MFNFIKTSIMSVLFCFLAMAAWSQPVTSVRPWLGIAIEKGPKGVLIKNTFPDTPAEKAGLRSGDEILKVVGVPVQTPEELVQEVTNKGVGFTVKVEFLRQGKLRAKDITLVVMPDMFSLTKQKLLNHKAPNFEALVVQGRGSKFHMQKQLGRVTLLDFWATWCMACLGTVPRLVQFAQKYKGKIDVISISGEEVPVIKNYLVKFEKRVPKKENPIQYLQSAEGKVNSLFMAAAIPMFVLINKNGIVVDLDLGGGTILDKILAKAEGLLTP
ncbi:MAG: PDZ domain-containing protein [Bdellovibrio sp.]|nr:PDZ domain-containing protein [Bdellovibrio sp.]